MRRLHSLAPLRLISIPGNFFASGNATAMASNIAAQEVLFRIGMVSELFCAVVVVFPGRGRADALATDHGRKTAAGERCDGVVALHTNACSLAQPCNGTGESGTRNCP